MTQQDRDQLVYAALLHRLADRLHVSAAHEAEGIADVAALLRDDDLESVIRDLGDALVSSAAHAIAAWQSFAAPTGPTDPTGVATALEHMAEARKRIAVAEAIALVATVRHDLGGPEPR